jgi:hypothetical protein
MPPTPHRHPTNAKAPSGAAIGAKSHAEHKIMPARGEPAFEAR